MSQLILYLKRQMLTLAVMCVFILVEQTQADPVLLSVICIKHHKGRQYR